MTKVERFGVEIMAKRQRHKFYVTGAGIEKPIECFGLDRLDALSRSGITVWTEAEYLDAMKVLAAPAPSPTPE